jgi:hypothetical protein
VRLESIPVRLTDLWRRDASGAIIIFSDVRYFLTAYKLGSEIAQIWELCDGRKTVAEIASASGAGPSHTSQHCLQTINAWEEEWLVREGGSFDDD